MVSGLIGSKRPAFNKTVTLVMALFLLSMAGCSTVDDVFTMVGFGGGESSLQTQDGLVSSAMEDFNRGEYKSAYEAFEEIKERFPFSQFSLLAELKAADCKFYLGEYAEAIVLYEDFGSNHPTNEAVMYVMFQVGMSFYKQIDTIDRDPGAAVDAIAALSRLLRSFPNSPYTDEANARRMAARNFLANHEFYVASFYIRTGELDQAEGRLRYLMNNYPDTTISSKAEIIVAAIDAGKPPERTWRDWIPDISLPDWKTFTSVKPGPVGAAPQ